MDNPTQHRATTTIRPAWIWLLAFATNLLILFPAAIRPYLWSAPLESGAALIAIVLTWLIAWMASQQQIPLKFYRRAWGGVITLAVAKALLIILTSTSGVEAQVTPANPAMITKQIASPLRPRGPHGLPVYRTPAIPPLFINDIRRFDFYGAERDKRTEIAHHVDIYAYVTLADQSQLLPAHPELGAITTTATENGQTAFAYHGIAASTEQAENPIVIATADGTSHSLTEQEVSPFPSGDQPSAITAKAFQTWSIMLMASLFCCAGWVSLNIGNYTGFTAKITSFLFPTIIACIAALLPVRWPFNWMNAAAAIALMVFALYVITRYRNRLTPTHYVGLNGLLFLSWCIIATRFFLDRYPGGFAVLAGGSDTLFHYTFASEILRGDWLHAADAPFSRQFFMRYIIAAVMLLIGEGPVWAIIVNVFAYGIIGLQLASILRTCKSRYWLIAPITWLGFAFVSPFKMWIPTLFPEVMSILFLLAGIDHICKWHHEQRRQLYRIAIGAIWIGLSIYTRNNYIISVPLILLLLWITPKQNNPNAARLHWRPCIVFAAIITGMVGLVALRNTMLAAPGEPFTLLLSSKIKALALYQGFLPSFIGDQTLIQNLAHEPLNMQFWHAIQQRPDLYVRFLLDRISVLLGGPAFIEPNLVKAYPPFNPVNTILFAGGILYSIYQILRNRKLPFAALLSWAIILPQVALVILMIGFVGEGYRFLLPCYPMLIIILALPNQGSISK